jgi:protein-tyrosine-phosphatase
VLFVCVGNAARSQMAEAFARHHGLEAESAGTQPAPRVGPRAVEVMHEKGIDLADHTPKLLDMTRLADFDRTVTMGCGVAESCPTLHTDEDWGLDDPLHLTIDAVRAIRDEIERRVLDLRDRLAR